MLGRLQRGPEKPPLLGRANPLTEARYMLPMPRSLSFVDTWAFPGHPLSTAALHIRKTFCNCAQQVPLLPLPLQRQAIHLRQRGVADFLLRIFDVQVLQCGRPTCPQKASQEAPSGTGTATFLDSPRRPRSIQDMT